MDTYLKIGELAKMTGITVRTLHYYDEVGLLKPTKITESEHRLYDINCVTTLYQIISLKDMGFNLEEISELIYAKNIDIMKFIDVQMSKVQEEIAQKQLLLSKLLKIKQDVKEHNHITLDDFRAIIPYINTSADRYFTKEQLDKIKNNLQSFQSETEEGSDWLTFIAKLTYCYHNKLSNTDQKARECVSYWKELINHSVGKDDQLKASVFSFHASVENSQLRYGLTDALYQYLLELMKQS